MSAPVPPPERFTRDADFRLKRFSSLADRPVPLGVVQSAQEVIGLLRLQSQSVADMTIHQFVIAQVALARSFFRRYRDDFVVGQPQSIGEVLGQTGQPDVVFLRKAKVQQKREVDPESEPKSRRNKLTFVHDVFLLVRFLPAP